MRPDRDRHQRMAGAPGKFEGVRRARRGDVEFRPRLLRRPRQRGEVLEGMKLSPMRGVLRGQQQPDLLQPFAEPRDRFIRRNRKTAEFVRQEGAGKTDVEAALRDAVEHGDLAGKLQRIVERRHHGAGDETHFFRALRRRGEKQQRVRAIAAVTPKIVLHRAGVAVAQRLGLLGDRQAFLEIGCRALVFGRDAGKELNAELHFRHPEVAAERPAKGDGPAPRLHPSRLAPLAPQDDGSQFCGRYISSDSPSCRAAPLRRPHADRNRARRIPACLA